MPVYFRFIVIKDRNAEYLYSSLIFTLYCPNLFIFFFPIAVPLTSAHPPSLLSYYIQVMHYLSKPLFRIDQYLFAYFTGFRSRTCHYDVRPIERRPIDVCGI